MPVGVPGLMKRGPSGSGPPPCGPGPIRGAAHPANAASPNPSAQRLPVIAFFLSRVACVLRSTPAPARALNVLHRNADPVLRKEFFARPAHVVPLADHLGRGRQPGEDRPAIG